jgi:transposase
MPKKLYHVNLTQTEREQLETYVKQGKKPARSMNRARILLLTDANHSDEDIMETLGLCRQTVYKVRKRYGEGQHQHIFDLLTEKPRPGQPIKVDSRVASHIATIACSDSPTGTTRWTLQMIANRLVELNIVESICCESVRKALKKTNSNPG